ncbi:MAG TPA: helix-turn-helix transcriptional regulator [Candidatus Acidoferrum sp.]|nr:helix-turn-helix transcriptional regulator [Candidatus Acidoferrum sp.]
MDSKSIDLTRLGYRIRFLRKGKNWSLADLAKESGLSKAYLSDLENGSAGKPNIQYIYSVAVALGVTLSELLQESGARNEGGRPKRGESELPSGLRDLQLELNLSDDDVEKLAQVSFRGNRPRDKEGWLYLIETLNMLGQRKPRN